MLSAGKINIYRSITYSFDYLKVDSESGPTLYCIDEGQLTKDITAENTARHMISLHGSHE